MKGGIDGGIEGKYRNHLPGDLSLATSRNKPRVRQPAWAAPTSPQSRKKSHMKITEVCDGNQVKKILQQELEKVTLKHGLNMYELIDLKKDLKNKSVVAGTDYKAACSNVRKHVAVSTKVVLRKRKDKAATKIQRQVRSNQGNKGRKSSMRATKEALHRGSKKHGPGGKSCTPDRLIGGLDSVLNDLKMKLDTSERRLVESAMKNAGKGAGGCNTVAVKKLFDGPYNIKNKAMTAYNKLGDNEGIKKYKTLKGAAEQRIKIADDKCLKMPEKSLEKHGYCKNSNNPQVKSRLDKLKANLQAKIKEEQPKIAKAAEVNAEKERQRQMQQTNRNGKMKKCVADAQTLYTDSATLLPIKPEHKVEDIEPLLVDVSARYDKLNQECDEFRQSRPYNEKRLTIQSRIATMQSAIKQKRRELAEKKAAAEKAKQEEALAAKKLENARTAKEQADKEASEKKRKIEAAKKAALLTAKLAKEAETKRLAKEAQEKAEKLRLEKVAKEKERLAKEAQEKKKKALAEAAAEAARLKAVEAEKKIKEAEEKRKIEKQKKEAAKLAAEKAEKLAQEQALKAEKLRLEKIAAEKKAADEKKKKEEARIKAELAEKKAQEEAKKLKIEADKKAALFAAKLLAQKKKKEADKKARDEAAAQKEKEHKQALVAAKMKTIALQAQLEELKKGKEENNEKLRDIEAQIKKLDEKVKQSNDAALKERADMIKKSLKNYTELLKA